MSKGNDTVVFMPTRNSTCAECKQELGHGAWITLDQKKNAFCLNCADLDHLVFLPFLWGFRPAGPVFPDPPA